MLGIHFIKYLSELIEFFWNEIFSYLKIEFSIIFHKRSIWEMSLFSVSKKENSESETLWRNHSEKNPFKSSREFRNCSIQNFNGYPNVMWVSVRTKLTYEPDSSQCIYDLEVAREWNYWILTSVDSVKRRRPIFWLWDC